MRRAAAIALALGLAASAPARADYWIVTPPGYRSIGGGSRCGPYRTYEEAMQVNRQYFDGRRPIEGSPSPDPVAAADGGGATGDPVFDAMRPLLMDLSSQFGAALGRALFGDPAEKARRAREEAWRRAQEAAREAARRQFAQDMADKEAREEARIREERHAKLSARLMRLGNGVFGDDGREAAITEMELRPGGTSFFGIGGGDEGREFALPPWSDPMVVDLRHVGTGGYLAQEALAAPPQDRMILLDQALMAANGGRVFALVGAPDKPPSVNPAGLQAFQTANAGYRTQQTVRKSKEERAREAVRRAAEARSPEARKAAVEASAEALEARGEEGFRRELARRALTAVSGPEAPALPAAMAKERAALMPTLAQRVEHAALKRYAAADAEGMHDFLKANYAMASDPALQARLDRLLRRVREASPYPDEPAGIRIVGAPLKPDEESGFEDSAFATSDAVYIGINDLKRSPPPTDDELLFTIAHETAHVHRDHYAVNILAIQKENVRDVVNGFLDPDQPVLSPAKAAYIRSGARKARMQELNYAQELEADRLGTLMALSAGAKADGVRAGFARMARDEAAWTTRIPTEAERKRVEITRDHPTPAARFETLRTIYGKGLGDPLK